MVALVLVLSLITVTSSSAGPFETGILAKIVATLALIERTLRETNLVVQATRERLSQVYPKDVILAIDKTFASIRSISEEVASLSCGWRFSPRVQRLWEGIFAGRRICRNEWAALFGSPPPYVLQDIDEYFDYQATRRLNMVATRVERGQGQNDFLTWLFDEAKRGREPDGSGPASPGYSQRLSALGA